MDGVRRGDMLDIGLSLKASTESIEEPPTSSSGPLPVRAKGDDGTLRWIYPDLYLSICSQSCTVWYCQIELDQPAGPFSSLPRLAPSRGSGGTADTPVLGTGAFGREGSSPSFRTQPDSSSASTGASARIA